MDALPEFLSVTRRKSLGLAAAALGLVSTLISPRRASAKETAPMKLTCIIRYQIDPFQLDEFRKYAETWGRVIPRCGGHLVGYFVPQEGTNDVAWGLIAFNSLADYEAYRARIRNDAEGRANFETAKAKRIILREERNFVGIVEGTFELPPI